MSEPKQLFSISRAEDAVFKTGLRSFMEYRDLGIERATHGTRYSRRSLYIRGVPARLPSRSAQGERFGYDCAGPGPRRMGGAWASSGRHEAG